MSTGETTNVPTLRELPAWDALTEHFQAVRDLHLRDLFDSDATRGERFVAEGAGLFLDYSKNRITDQTLVHLLELAEQVGLEQRIEAMFRGEHINVSEDRAVLMKCWGLPPMSATSR